MRKAIYALFVFLTACSTLPVSIETAPPEDIQLKDVNDNVPRYIGQTVRWGGEIVEVANDNNYSTLQIVQFPLNRFGRPITSKTSQGRFLAQSTEFLDPVVYKEGKRITFSGTVDSEQTRVVDDKTLTIPVINISESHSWLDKRPLDQRYYLDLYYPYGFYGYGYAHPYRYYHGYGVRYYHRH